MIYVDVGDDVSTEEWLPASLFLHNLLSERSLKSVRRFKIATHTFSRRYSRSR